MGTPLHTNTLYKYRKGSFTANIHMTEDGHCIGIVHNTKGLITFVSEDASTIDFEFGQAIGRWRSLSMRELKQVRRSLDK